MREVRSREHPTVPAPLTGHEPALEAAAVVGPRPGPVAKFGGRPWGLDPAHWPRGTALLCQLPHDPPRLDLGGDRVLFLWHFFDYDLRFTEPGYEPGAFSTLLPRAALGEGWADPPAGCGTLGEFAVAGWRKAAGGREEGLQRDRHPNLHESACHDA